MNAVSKKQFVIGDVLMSLGWFSFLWIDDLMYLFFNVAFSVWMPREEFHRPVRGRELLCAPKRASVGDVRRVDRRGKK